MTVDTHTAELEARLKAAAEALGVEKKRVQELELALKRKRDSEMDVEQEGDEEEDWDGRPAAKKGKAAAVSTVCQSSLSFPLTRLGSSGRGLMPFHTTNRNPPSRASTF